jgi:hypothetical protein
MNLEEELRQALRRESAPDDFASQILARTRVTRPFWPRAAAMALAASLAVAALIPSAIGYRERRRALQAKEQLATALTITSIQLQQIKEKIYRNMRPTL